MHKSYLLMLGVCVGLAAMTSVSIADEVSMLNKCRSYAAKRLRVDPNLIDVKYEGQRTDKTYAVNGGVGPSQAITFQCSFKSDGKTIKRFTKNAMKPVAPKGCPADVSQADRYKYPDCN